MEKDDGLPQYFCCVCLKEVTGIYNFQKKCRQNQRLLAFALTKVKQELMDKMLIKQADDWFEFSTNQRDSNSETNKRIAKMPENNTFSSCLFPNEFRKGYPSASIMRQHQRRTHGLVNQESV